MKKFKKVLLSLSIILFWANNTYATTTGKYMAASDDTDSGKLILLLIAIGLVAIVLFLGYKLDQSDAQEKRKEQITRKNKIKTEEPDYNTYAANQEKEYSEEDELEYEKEYKKLSEETAVMQTLYSNNEEKIEKTVENVIEVKKEIIPEETYKTDDDLYNSSSEATMAIDTSAIKEMIDDEESILPTDTAKKYTRKKVEKEVEEKPKKAKTTTKKAAETKTKKTTTKKVAKKVEKEAEEKPKKAKTSAKTSAKKAAETKTKKTTTKKVTKKVEKAAEEKPKKAKASTKKVAETKAKTTKKTTEKK